MISAIKRGLSAVPSLSPLILAEDDVVINGQILHIVPSEIRDGDEVWIWNRDYESGLSSIPGRYVLPVNPTPITRNALNPAYEFTKSELQGLSASLFTKLDPSQIKDLPHAKKTALFPYRSRGKHPYFMGQGYQGLSLIEKLR